MSSHFEYATLMNPKAAKQLRNILAQCFNGNPEDETYYNRVGKQNFRVVQLRERVIGGLALLPMGQWFSGQCIPMTGIASVGITPEHRRSGAASFLMQHVLQELFDSEISLSALYPSTQQLYRKAGYEQAGTIYSWELLTKGIEINMRSLPIEPIASLDHQFIHPLYQRQAKLTNGHLERSSVIWESLLQSGDRGILYGYLLGSIDQPEGYFIYSQHSHNGALVLQVEDWVVLTAAAAERLWTFISDHSSQIQKVTWKGAAVDTLTLVLPENPKIVHSADTWMLRIVNVKNALEKRGYPRGVEGELHLRIEDKLLPENSGKYILSVANGRGFITPGGRGELQLEISTLAPLLTGLFTPFQLKTAGRIESTEETLSAAASLFAGESPWMPDRF